MPQHQYDKTDFYKVLKEFPNQFSECLQILEPLEIAVRPKRVVISGMGGSALPGDIVNSYLRGEAIVYMNRDYGVPHWVDDETLVICVSYSGDTEETLESYLDAKDRGASLAVITSGGELARRAEADRVPVVRIPGGLQPRCATGYLFTAMLGILMKSEMIGSQHHRHLTELGAELQAMDFETRAEKMAHVLKGHVPVIYAADRFHSLARIWKIKINENSKVQAFHNVFPELNHNEMVGFTTLMMKPYLVILKSPTDHERIKKRMEMTKQILAERDIPVLEIDMVGKTLLSQIFSTLLLGDWVSYYLAKEYETDPMPVEMVEDFKRKMKEE